MKLKMDEKIRSGKCGHAVAGRWMRVLFAAVVIGMANYGPEAMAQSNVTPIELTRQLDRAVRFSIDGTIPEVLTQIQAATGLTVKVSDGTYDLLPWGNQTTLKASVENQTLRQSVSAMAGKLGLVMIVRDDHVELVPSPALQRLGKRATALELSVLDHLSSTPANIVTRAMTAQDLIREVDLRLAKVHPDLSVENRAGEVLGTDLLLPQRNATLAGVLDLIDSSTRATWYPWGQSVVIVPKDEAVKLRLEQTIAVNFTNESATNVLASVSDGTKVSVQYEPGALARVQDVLITLKADSISLGQVLDFVCGMTGLRYKLTDSGVYMWYPPAAAGIGQAGNTPQVQKADPVPAAVAPVAITPAAAAPAAARDPVVLIIPGPDGSQILVTESQLPEDVRQYLMFKRQQAIEAIRKEMKAQEQQQTP